MPRKGQLNFTVPLGITLPKHVADRLEEEVGNAYGAKAKFVREAIIAALENRDAEHWRKMYNGERTRRQSLERYIERIKAAVLGG